MIEYREQDEDKILREDIILNGTKIGEIWPYKDLGWQYTIDGFQKKAIISPSIHGICDNKHEWLESAIEKANEMIADLNGAIKMLEGI